MLTTERKQEIVKKFGGSTNNSGSVEVQVALLTERINGLMGHFKQHKHDYSSNRGLLKMVGQRKRLLKYVSTKDHDRYKKLIKELGLRK